MSPLTDKDQRKNRILHPAAARKEGKFPLAGGLFSLGFQMEKENFRSRKRRGGKITSSRWSIFTWISNGKRKFSQQEEERRENSL